jgi:hypothetical protein
LSAWIKRLADQWASDEHAFVYFNNDHRACALRDAIVFERLSRGAGMHPTRVPERDEVTLG